MGVGVIRHARRLPAGVPGRSVLLYSPLDAVIKEAR